MNTTPTPTRTHLTGPWHYLGWLVRSQRTRVTWGALLGSTWMVGLTVPPLLLSYAVNDGLRHGVDGRIWLWAGILVMVGLVVAALAILRHRTMSWVRVHAAQQTIRAAAEQAIRLGSSMRRRTEAGEVAAIGVGDAWTMARSLTVTGPGEGAVVASVVIAVALLRISPLLAVVVMVGVPAMLLLLGPLLGRFRARGTEHREATAQLSGRVEDIVSGLQVLTTLGAGRCSPSAGRSSPRGCGAQVSAWRRSRAGSAASPWAFPRCSSRSSCGSSRG